VNWMAERVPQTYFSLNCLMSAIMICYRRPQVYYLCHIYYFGDSQAPKSESCS
jgi:hypothetical protein